MIINTALSLAVGIALLATIVTIPTVHAQQARPTVVVKHRPIVSKGDVSASWDARQNVIDSKRYEHLLATNPAFRRERMRIECGSITDPQLTEALQVMLLNNIKIKHPASQIVATDWAKGVAVVQLPRGGMRAVHFDPTTLQVN